MSDSAEFRQYDDQGPVEIVAYSGNRAAVFVDTGQKSAVANVCAHFDGTNICRRITLSARCRRHRKSNGNQ